MRLVGLFGRSAFALSASGFLGCAGDLSTFPNNTHEEPALEVKAIWGDEMGRDPDTLRHLRSGLLLYRVRSDRGLYYASNPLTPASLPAEYQPQSTRWFFDDPPDTAPAFVSRGIAEKYCQDNHLRLPALAELSSIEEAIQKVSPSHWQRNSLLMAACTISGAELPSIVVEEWCQNGAVEYQMQTPARAELILRDGARYGAQFRVVWQKPANFVWNGE